MLEKMSKTTANQLARYLARLPYLERVAVLCAYPSEDKVKIVEELKRIKDDTPQHS